MREEFLLLRVGQFQVSQLRLYVALFLCLSVCLSVYALQEPCLYPSRKIFTKLHTQVDLSPGKNRLDFQSHGVKGQGHAATTIQIFCTP